MSCVKTYSGISFDPLNPTPEMICPEDIAHALSLMCRANGHIRSFYSVGQHSINCMKEAAARGYSRRVQLGCLLHDASEAYLSDITRPVKKEIPRYLEIETPLQELIWQMYLGSPLTQEEYRQVFEIDDDLLLHEFIHLMPTPPDDCPGPLSGQLDFSSIPFAQCEQLFLEHLARLTQTAE